MKLFREARSELLALQKREQFTFALLHLIHRTLARSFVGTPSQKFCPVSKSATGEMVIGHFYYYSRTARSMRCQIRRFKRLIAESDV
jgi:hypothetical protein